MGDTRPRKPLLALAGALLTLSFAPAAASATVTTFSNDAGITVPAMGVATPYPSKIPLMGLTGTTTDVKVRLKGITGTDINQVSALLAPFDDPLPPMAFGALAFSEVGMAGQATPVTWTFGTPGTTIVCGAAVPSGTYNPGTDCPVGGEPDFAGTIVPWSGLNGLDPNRVWSLYVLDSNSGGGITTITGWDLILTTPDPSSSPPPVPPVTPQLLNPSGIHFPTVVKVDLGVNRTPVTVGVPPPDDNSLDLAQFSIFAPAAGVPLDKPLAAESRKGKQFLAGVLGDTHVLKGQSQVSMPLTLTGKGRRALRQTGKLNVTLNGTARNAAGPVAVSARLKLIRKKGK